MELLQNAVTQGIMLLAVALLMALVVARADPEMYYARFYAKDTGMLVDALHGMRGDVDLTYNNLQPDYQFRWNFTEQAIYIALSNETKGWNVRQQWGRTTKEPPIVVDETLMVYPYVIEFHKRPGEIRFDENFDDTCPGEPVESATVQLHDRGKGALVTKLLKDLEQEPGSRLVHLAVGIRDEEGLLIKVGGGKEAKESEQFSCLLVQSLRRVYDDISTEQLPYSRDDIAAFVELPASFNKSRAEATASAIRAAVEAFR